ncbi:probable helicase senataxin isoform X12 [Myotis myotis]|uniref:probable helicase senataxin isoform X12 n=1 Tax=Myotis myotis TaxID=51298 RepID=UPI001747FC70|nr:probable helicase senataxin isoform X12 [Myotis myotis]
MSENPHPGISTERLTSLSRYRMSTCCWCTPGGVSAIEFLQRYASRTQSSEFQTADEDLCYCLECVTEYHKARDELPFLHEVLWELETLRLINHFEKSMKAEMEGDDDELYIIDNNGEAQPFDFTGQDFENKLRVPLLEILKYPYLLLHEHVNELCVEALCRMEQANCSFQVFEKQPGIYLFLVHPNEMVRRWAILTAKGLGKVDRDDYYDLQEVLTCLFKVIELGLLENTDIYTTTVLEKGKLIILPPHMYDTSNYKNYWLGICMLLTILEEQAMDSLLLGSDKQNDFMQSILHTMKRQSEDDSEDPFWPALHCFMVILDRLGSKVWGQLIDPIEAFQTIIDNASYNREIQNIRNSSVRAKSEPESCLDDLVTCSQIVYNYNPEKTKKVAQEWISSPNRGKFYELQLRKFPAEYKKYWEFVRNCGDINLVRLGPEKSINNEVLRFSLDNQVNHRIMKKDLPYVQEMHRRKEHLDHQLDELSRQRALSRYGRGIQRQELDEKIAQVSKERQELASKIKEVQGRPQKTQSNIILESHIICCTLSTSGGLLLESAFRGQGGVPFSCVIVDEAGQACEVETLTPLIHRCNKLILVGDPKQLPPTVISLTAQDYGYEQSMMARFCKLLEENVEHLVSGRLPVLQLTVQYRMHPDICLFPSNYIYNKSLKTNRGTESARCSSSWPFQPYLVFDVGDGSERRENDSYVNIQEIKVVMELIKLLRDKGRDVNFRNVGIITHYKAQKMKILKELDKEFEGRGLAEVDTVDAFQGRQKDCIIVTCVRANAIQGSIGFLASLQRLNVAITRAKYSLFILGHLRTLMDNQHWNHLIQDAQRRGAIVKTCDKNYKQDAMKILKLKSVLQRSLTYPPSAAPEGSSPQGGSPGSDQNRTLLGDSLYRASVDAKEAADSVAGKDLERPPVKDQLRDPRLLRRMSISAEAPGNCPRDPEPRDPQHSEAAPPLGVPGFPVSPRTLDRALKLCLATWSSHRAHVPCEPPGASIDSTNESDQQGGHSHQREARAVSDRDQEMPSPGNHHPKRSSSWDDGRAEEEDSGSKKRKL